MRAWTDGFVVVAQASTSDVAKDWDIGFRARNDGGGGGGGVTGHSIPSDPFLGQTQTLGEDSATGPKREAAYSLVGADGGGL